MTSTSQYHDVEASAPVYAVPIVHEPQVEVVRPTPATIIYVRDNQEQFVDPDPHPGMLPCAMFGCIFAWIPLIGIINFLVNMNAPHNSRRRMFAQSSCFIASFIIFFNILFWPFRY